MNSSSRIISFSDDFKQILLTDEKRLPTSESLSSAQWFTLDSIHHFQKGDGKLVCEQLAKAWEFMPNSQPPYLVEKPSNNQVIFFGGSFNPWHAGHEECINKLKLPHNTFIIPDNNPLKISSVQASECAWSRYLNLKAKVVSSVHIYPGFWTTEKANPTSSWLPAIKDSHPELRIGLLIGFDNFMTIHQWIEPDKLLRSLSDLFIVSRLDNEIAKLNQIEFLDEFYPNIQLHFLGHHSFEDISSSKIRDN